VTTPTIPPQLVAICSGEPERQLWLGGLPATLVELAERWSLRLGEPFEGKEVSGAWVARVERADGSSAVLKLGLPHMEGRDEIEGLRFWAGEPTVHLLDADAEANAMLLEACEPGTVLRTLPEPEQDVVLAAMLRRLWRVPEQPHPFRPLAEMTAYWASETEPHGDRWLDPGLVRDGLSLFDELPRTATSEVLLATDLHAGNVLRAQREPWLVIDPKPFLGDPAYDATQHLFNCDRLWTEPLALVRRFAHLLELDAERVRLWTFARAAAEWSRPLEAKWVALAKLLAG
jgi:streptomycin 6-kinase